MQIVGTLRPPRRFPGLLNGRQKQSDQHGDDGNHHQQFNERKPASAAFLHHDDDFQKELRDGTAKEIRKTTDIAFGNESLTKESDRRILRYRQAELKMNFWWLMSSGNRTLQSAVRPYTSAISSGFSVWKGGDWQRTC